MARGLRRHRHHKTEYLVPVHRTWEPEEKILPAYPTLVVDYTSQWVRETTVVKIEESDSTQGYPAQDISNPETFIKHASLNDQCSPSTTLVDGQSLKCKSEDNSSLQRKKRKKKKKQRTRDLACCKYCLKSFPSSISLAEHIYTHFEDKPYTCPHCDKGWATKKELDVHIVRTHSFLKPFQCFSCDRRFFHKSHLTAHVHTHTQRKTLECETCNQRFSLLSTLRKHFRSHKIDKQYACNFCKKTFSLESHFLEHTCSCKEKTYQCRYCSGSFSRKLHLRNHICLAGNTKSFQCNFCDRSFNTLSHMAMHRTRLHTYRQSIADNRDLNTEETFHECNSCDKKFSTIYLLVNHSQRHKQKEKFICDKCDKSFRTNGTLMVHKRTHITKSNLST